VELKKRKSEMLSQTLKIAAKFITTLAFCLLAMNVYSSGEYDWEIGIAKSKITPQESMWLGGYAARDHAYEGILHDIWIKALAFKDRKGKMGVFVTMDLISIPKDLSNRVRDRLEEQYGLSRKQVILNVSHTHTGPEIRDNVWPISEDEIKKIHNYVAKLEVQIVKLVETAFNNLEPSQVFAANGLTRFQVNRRNNKEQELQSFTELNGPNDYAVPVIKVLNAKEELTAILFGYACHPTVLNGYQISGDYPGFAQIELEKQYPGATALFFQGAGADQNPLPRRSIALATQYGKELSAAVARVLDEEMSPLVSSLSMTYSEIEIGMDGAPPTEAALKILLDNKDNPPYLRYRLGLLYDRLRSGEKLPSGHPYPVQVWKIGDQPLFTFGGELVIGYAIELKRIFGDNIFVAGYSNDVMGYVPTLTVLHEGGYEGNRSPYPNICPWEDNVETLIIAEARKLAKKVNIAERPSGEE